MENWRPYGRHSGKASPGLWGTRQRQLSHRRWSGGRGRRTGTMLSGHWSWRNRGTDSIAYSLCQNQRPFSCTHFSAISLADALPRVLAIPLSSVVPSNATVAVLHCIVTRGKVRPIPRVKDPEILLVSENLETASQLPPQTHSFTIIPTPALGPIS